MKNWTQIHNLLYIRYVEYIIQNKLRNLWKNRQKITISGMVYKPVDIILLRYWQNWQSYSVLHPQIRRVVDAECFALYSSSETNYPPLPRSNHIFSGLRSCGLRNAITHHRRVGSPLYQLPRTVARKSGFSRSSTVTAWNNERAPIILGEII